MSFNRLIALLVAAAILVPGVALAKDKKKQEDDDDRYAVHCSLSDDYLVPVLARSKNDGYDSTKTEYLLTESVTLPNGMHIKYDVGGCIQYIYNFTFENIPQEIVDNNPDLLLRARKLISMIPLKPEYAMIRTTLEKFIAQEASKKRLLANMYMEKQNEMETVPPEQQDPYLQEDIDNLKKELEGDYVSAACGDAVCSIRIDKKYDLLVITYSLAI